VKILFDHAKFLPGGDGDLFLGLDFLRNRCLTETEVRKFVKWKN